MEPGEENKPIEDKILELLTDGLIEYMEGNTIGEIKSDFKDEEEIERFRNYTNIEFLTLYKIKLLAETEKITKEQASALIKLFKEKIKVQREYNAEVEKEMSDPKNKSKQKLLLGFINDKFDEEIKKTNIVGNIDLKNILIGIIKNEDYSNIPSAKEIEDKLKKLKYK